MPDLEQPEPSRVTRESEFERVIEPLREDEPDADEVQGDMMADECARQARMTASYWLTLRENEIPARDCTALTTEWLWLGNARDEDDD